MVESMERYVAESVETEAAVAREPAGQQVELDPENETGG
jgi:hypothetical protein